MQAYLRESLNTMASKLGELQARLVRLDALGDRLTKVAGLKPQEFMFDRPPAQGGADSDIPARQLSLGQLGTELDRLAMELEDRTDKLRYLESTLTEQHAKRQLIPSKAPVKGGYLVGLWLAHRPVQRDERFTKDWTSWPSRARLFSQQPAALWCLRPPIRSMVIWSRSITATTSSPVTPTLRRSS
jgi:hypothetical protein